MEINKHCTLIIYEKLSLSVYKHPFKTTEVHSSHLTFRFKQYYKKIYFAIVLENSGFNIIRILNRSMKFSASVYKINIRNIYLGYTATMNCLGYSR